MLHSLVQKTSETHVVSAYPTVIPTTFRDAFGQLVHQLLSDGKICRRRLCFMVTSCVIHCFRLRFSHLNQSIDQLGTVSISKSEFIFSRWLGRFLASLGRRTGSMFWGELISLSENIWKQKTFPGAKSFESEAFDCVWLRSTLLRDYSIGECDPTWHNM